MWAGEEPGGDGGRLGREGGAGGGGGARTRRDGRSLRVAIKFGRTGLVTVRILTSKARAYLYNAGIKSAKCGPRVEVGVRASRRHPGLAKAGKIFLPRANDGRSWASEEGILEYRSRNSRSGFRPPVCPWPLARPDKTGAAAGIVVVVVVVVVVAVGDGE
jgi:hypothetical protein